MRENSHPKPFKVHGYMRQNVIYKSQFMSMMLLYKT